MRRPAGSLRRRDLATLTAGACREMVFSSRPEDRKVIGLRHLACRPPARRRSASLSPRRFERADPNARSAALVASPGFVPDSRKPVTKTCNVASGCPLYREMTGRTRTERALLRAIVPRHERGGRPCRDQQRLRGAGAELYQVSGTANGFCPELYPRIGESNLTIAIPKW
jgi:hypothetical protein